MSDPTSQFTISAVVSTVAIVVSIGTAFYLYWKQVSKRQLSYKIISDSKTLTNKYSEKLRITYDGQQVSDIRILTVKIWNSGNEPITTANYLEPIRIRFDTTVLSAEVAKTEPIDINVSLNCSKNEVRVEPTLLNSQDSITLAIFLTGLGEKIQFSARIVGVPLIEKIEFRRTKKVAG